MSDPVWVEYEFHRARPCFSWCGRSDGAGRFTCSVTRSNPRNHLSFHVPALEQSGTCSSLPCIIHTPTRCHLSKGCFPFRSIHSTAIIKPPFIATFAEESHPKNSPSLPDHMH